MQVPGQRVSPQVKAHVSVLLGILALVRAGQYWLERYDLVFSTRGAVDGATYTDVNVQVKALYLLMIISITAFVLFIVNIRRRGWVLPGIAVGLWLFVIVLAGETVPALVQRFRVKPDEPSKEAIYIRHNIAATRDALGLADVDEQRVRHRRRARRGRPGRQRGHHQEHPAVGPGRGPGGLRTQPGLGPRDFYSISDVDVDRYTIDGETTQVNIAARDLSRDGSRSRRGCRSTSPTRTASGRWCPRPTRSAATGSPCSTCGTCRSPREPGAPEIKQPRVTSARTSRGYVIVNSGVNEVDFTDDDGDTRFTNYTGQDGVKLDSFVRRAAFALRFGDINPLISSNVKSNSKLLLQRNVMDRVEAAAPFLQFDSDPYPVIVDGRIVYVIDGYTTTDHYPNAQRADNQEIADGAGLSGRFNYVRNSVKATVDAYDGTIAMYVVDEKDPLIRAYQKAFPELFSPASAIPTGLEAHFRYPEDLFRVQTRCGAGTTWTNR